MRYDDPIEKACLALFFFVIVASLLYLFFNWLEMYVSFFNIKSGVTILFYVVILFFIVFLAAKAVQMFRFIGYKKVNQNNAIYKEGSTITTFNYSGKDVKSSNIQLSPTLQEHEKELYDMMKIMMTMALEAKRDELKSGQDKNLDWEAFYRKQRKQLKGGRE